MADYDEGDFIKVAGRVDMRYSEDAAALLGPNFKQTGTIGAFSVYRKFASLFLEWEGVYGDAQGCLDAVTPSLKGGEGCFVIVDDLDSPTVLWERGGNAAFRLLTGMFWRKNFDVGCYMPEDVRYRVKKRFQELREADVEKIKQRKIWTEDAHRHYAEKQSAA